MMAFGIAIIFISLTLIEYGKILGIDNILRKLARPAGAAELCHACAVETADERDTSIRYSVIGVIVAAAGIRVLVVGKQTKIEKFH